MHDLYLRDDLARLWRQEDPFERVAALEGEVYRAVATRRTLRFEAGGRSYFAKIHRGVGWSEIAKNLVTMRLPVIGARNEFAACRHLEQHGIAAPRVAGFGERGWNPARRFSFVICDALEGRESLEDVGRRWAERPPGLAEKRRLIRAVAELARAMHGAGVVHRDFYVCHLLVAVAEASAEAGARPSLAVIDLHRAQLWRRIPGRWRRRDLAALLFSVLDLPLSQRDWWLFVRVYRGRPLSQVMRQESALWRSVHRRALALYRKGRRKGLVAGAGSE